MQTPNIADGSRVRVLPDPGNPRALNGLGTVVDTWPLRNSGAAPRGFIVKLDDGATTITDRVVAA